MTTIRLLGRYGVDTVFGIPGVHTLDFYRGLDKGGVRHIQARNEQGAGFMADGYARVTGKPGVALVISGPGVTNAKVGSSILPGSTNEINELHTPSGIVRR